MLDRRRALVALGALAFGGAVSTSCQSGVSPLRDSLSGHGFQPRNGLDEVCLAMDAAISDRESSALPNPALIAETLYSCCDREAGEYVSFLEFKGSDFLRRDPTFDQDANSDQLKALDLLGIEGFFSLNLRYGFSTAMTNIGAPSLDINILSIDDGGVPMRMWSSYSPYDSCAKIGYLGNVQGDLQIVEQSVKEEYFSRYISAWFLGAFWAANPESQFSLRNPGALRIDVY